MRFEFIFDVPELFPGASIILHELRGCFVRIGVPVLFDLLLKPTFADECGGFTETVVLG